MGFRLLVEDLVIGFKKQPVLKIDRFVLNLGDKILITGESGSGKSQFLFALMGLTPAANLWSGQFIIEEQGLPPQCLDYNQYRRLPLIRERYSAVFQDARHSLHPYRAINRQCPDNPRLFRHFHLDPAFFLDTPTPRIPSACSGGECQRLSLMFPADQDDRDVLLLDEPLTDIDQIAQARIRRIIGDDFLSRADKTVVMVTHNPRWALHRMSHYRIIGDSLPRSLVPADAVFGRPAPRRPRAKAGGFPFFRIKLPGVFPIGSAEGGGEGFNLFPMSIELGEREALGLIGESGSGKTTLARIAAGLFVRKLYDRELQVSIRVSGNWTNLARLPPRSRYRLIQIVAQDSSGSVNPRESVGDNLKWIRGRTKAKAGFDERLGEWGERLQLFKTGSLAHFRALRFAELSMGMQRRLNLLRALLLLDLDNEAQPKLLVLDEVSRGLDEDNIARLVDTVQAVQAEHNVGLLIISHDLGFISQVCNQTRMLFRGALLPKRLGPNELNTPERIDALNPYYRDFIQGADEERIPPEDREPLDSFGGCLYARYIRCVNRHQTGCIDVQLNRAGEIGLCE